MAQQAIKFKVTKESGKREPFNLLTIIMLVVLIIYVISLFTPCIWSIYTSLKGIEEFRKNAIALPAVPQFANYAQVFKILYIPIQQNGVTVKIWMENLFLNALIYSLSCALTSSFVPLVVSYLCARFPYKFSKIVHTTVIVVMILPIVGALPSEILMSKSFGLYDQLWGLAIMRGHFLGMYFLIYYGMFKSLPMAYTEAAKIDGAGNLSIFIKIILPLVKNTFFTVMLIHFIGFWNDYNTPLIYMPSYPTIAYAMYYWTQNTLNEMSYTPMRMALAMFLFIPVFIVFLAFHKRLLGNLTVGGLKG